MTFRAFSTVKPDSEYVKNAKFNVVYSPNEHFTVVLVLEDKLRDAWHSSTSVAFQRLNMLITDEFAYHRGNTLLIRKLPQNLMNF